MLSRNNFKERQRKTANNKQRFSIKRIGFITASVLVGLAFAGGCTVHADSVSQSSVKATVVTSSVEKTVSSSSAQTMSQAQAQSQSKQEQSSAKKDSQTQAVAAQSSSQAQTAAVKSSTSSRVAKQAANTTRAAGVSSKANNSEKQTPIKPYVPKHYRALVKKVPTTVTPKSSSQQVPTKDTEAESDQQMVKDEGKYNVASSETSASINNTNGYLTWSGWFQPKGYHQYRKDSKSWMWVNSGATDWRPFMMYMWPSKDVQAQYIKYFVNHGFSDADIGLDSASVAKLNGTSSTKLLNATARKVRDAIEKQIVEANYNTGKLASTMSDFMKTVPGMNYHSELPVEDVKGYVPSNSGSTDDDQLVFLNNDSTDQKKGNTANADSQWRLLNRTILNQDGKHPNNLVFDLLVGNDIDNSNPVVQAEQINWEYYLLNYGNITGQGSAANFDGFRNDAADNMDADVLDQQAQLMNDLYGIKSSETNSLNHLAYNEGYHAEGATMLKNKNYQQLYMDSWMFYALHSNLGRNQGNLSGFNKAGIVNRLKDTTNVTGSNDTSITPNWSFVNNHDQQKNIINQWIIDQHPGVPDIMAAGYKPQYAVDAWNAFYADQQKVNKQFTQMNVPAQYAILLTNKDTIPTVYYGDLYNETKSYMTSKSIYYDAIANLLKARKKYVTGGQTMACANGNPNLLVSVRLGKGVKDVNSVSNDPLAKTTGMVVVVSNKPNLNKQTILINVGKEHAGQKFINIMDTTKSTADGDMSGLNATGNHAKDAVADANGFLKVSVQGYANPLVNGYLGVWVPDGAAADQVAATAASTANKNNGKSYVSDAASDSKVLYEDFSLFQPMEKTASDRAYTKIAANAQNFADMGITDFWMAPPYTSFGMSRYNEGYSLNDRYTLGTDANPTKYGTGTELATALKAIHKAGMHAQVDLVMNQMIGLSGQEPVTVRRATAYGNLKTVDGKTYDNLVYLAYTVGGGDGQKTYGGKFLAQLQKDHPDLFTTKAISTGVAPDPSAKIQQWSAKYYNGSSLQNIGTGLVMREANGDYDYLASDGNYALNQLLPKALVSSGYWEHSEDQDSVDVKISYQDENGNQLTVSQPISISGVAGKKVNIPAAPSVNGYVFDRATFDGQPVNGAITLNDLDNELVYIYKPAPKKPNNSNQGNKGKNQGSKTNPGKKNTNNSKKAVNKKTANNSRKTAKKKASPKYAGTIKTVKGKKIAVDKKGRKLTGFQKVMNPKTKKVQTSYFSKKKGTMLKGLQRLYRNGHWNRYYFSIKDGRMLTGFRKLHIKGHWYHVYLSKRTGAMLTGLRKIKGHKYYFRKSNGNMLKSFRHIKVRGHWYHVYFSKRTGQMLTGLRKIRGHKYYFRKSNGNMLKGFRHIKVRGHWYHVYFSKKTGRMLTGTHRIGRYRYRFSKRTGRILSARRVW